jgi:glycine cleavage system H protein
MNAGADRLRFSEDHLWFARDGGCVTVGVTERISRILTWVNGVALPPVGARLVAGEELATIDSQKVEISLTTPIALDVVTVNDALAGDPMLVRMDPRGTGWLLRAAIEDEQWSRLLAPTAYEEVLRST